MPFLAPFPSLRDENRTKEAARPGQKPSLAGRDHYGVVTVVTFEYPENPPGLCARTR
jgi:hypothetical protein